MTNDAASQGEEKMTVHAVREAVAARIAGSAPEVFEKVAGILAQETIDKRVKQLVASMTEFDNKSRDLKKLRPDVVSYNAAGQAVTENYSKAAVEARAKLTKRIDKIEQAIAKALADPPNYDALMSLGDGKTDKSDADAE